MYKVFKEIMGVLGIIYSIAVLSMLFYKMFFTSTFELDIQLIPGVLLHVAILYYSWHWMNGIVFYNDETFLTVKDKYYKEAVKQAQEALPEFIELYQSRDVELQAGIIQIKFKNYKQKIVRGPAFVDEIDTENKTIKVSLLKEIEPDFQEDYRAQKISFDDVEDWYFFVGDGSFKGGFIQKAKIKKADDKGYDFDYKSQEIVDYYRNNK